MSLTNRAEVAVSLTTDDYMNDPFSSTNENIVS